MKTKFINKFFQNFLIICLLLLLKSCAVSKLLNSGTVQLKYTNTEATFKGVKYENKEKIGEVSLSVRNVQHPSKYGDWNTNIRLTPSIHFDRFTYEAKKKEYDSEGNDVTPGDVKIRRIPVFINTKLNFHTPVGAFVLTGGYGRAGYRKTDTEGLDTYRSHEIVKLDFSWIGFISKHFFLMMGPRYFKEDYESKVFALRIGYMWGRTK